MPRKTQTNVPRRTNQLRLKAPQGGYTRFSAPDPELLRLRRKIESYLTRRGIADASFVAQRLFACANSASISAGVRYALDMLPILLSADKKVEMKKIHDMFSDYDA